MARADAKGRGGGSAGGISRFELPPMTVLITSLLFIFVVGVLHIVAKLFGK